MQPILDFVHRLGDPRALVAWGGYVGLTFIIFAETGLLVGFFLPGDSVLVTAGLLASQTQRFDLNVYLLGLLLSVASIAGNSLGYYIGVITGPPGASPTKAATAVPTPSIGRFDDGISST